ncbi:MAG: hypothetical protein IIZ57_07670 [Solobacterium sp.]|nr:hypothetical protein [Solobacterium sp.]
MNTGKHRINILSDLVIPALLGIPMIMTGFTLNYSGIAAEGLPVFYVCLVPVMVYTVIMTYRTAVRYRIRFLWAVYISLFILTLVIPYHVPEDISSHIHLICAYGSVLVFNVIILRSLLPRPELMRFYLFMCVIAGLTCLSDGTINGPAELIYALSISVILSRV